MLVAASIAAIFLVLTGVCTDKDVSCGHWAADGQCVTNPEAMMPVCPLSCGVCKYECNDTQPACVGWAQAGECETNPKFMLRSCPTSCGLCHPECVDRDERCAGFAGECANSKWMVPHVRCLARCLAVQGRPRGMRPMGCRRRVFDNPSSCSMPGGIMRRLLNEPRRRLRDENATACAALGTSGSATATQRTCTSTAHSCGLCRTLQGSRRILRRVGAVW